MRKRLYDMASSEILNAITESFSVLFMGKNFLRLLSGLWVTIEISALSVALSCMFGLVFGAVMTIKFKPLRALCKVFLEFMRIMPQLALLFIAYYGLTRAFGISLTGEAASVLVFTLWGTAEMGDLVRSSLISIPQHEYDSARALGLKEYQVYLYVIIPQTVRRLIPLTMNLITRMVKTTSLVVFVGVIEVVKIAQQIIDANRLTVPTASIAVYLVVFFMYFIVCYPLSIAARKLEAAQCA